MRSRAPLTLLIHTDCLLDRAALAEQMPAALAGTFAARHGGSAADWEDAYRRLLADWASYWADLDLGGDDSLAQWREGRWRVVRAHFRLVGQPALPLSDLPFYLDEFPEQVGARVNAWRAGALAALRALAANGASVVVLAPTLPASLVRGMLPPDAAAALGPDELGQFGLEGLLWPTLARLAGGDPARTLLVGVDMPGARSLPCPADLSLLSSQIA